MLKRLFFVLFCAHFFKFDDVAVSFRVIKHDGNTLPGERVPFSEPGDVNGISECEKEVLKCFKLVSVEVYFNFFAVVVVELSFFEPDF